VKPRIQILSPNEDNIYGELLEMFNDPMFHTVTFKILHQNGSIIRFQVPESKLQYYKLGDKPSYTHHYYVSLFIEKGA
jgi:hypothetical protein